MRQFTRREPRRSEVLFRYVSQSNEFRETSTLVLFINPRSCAQRGQLMNWSGNFKSTLLPHFGTWTVLPLTAICPPDRSSTSNVESRCIGSRSPTLSQFPNLYVIEAIRSVLVIEKVPYMHRSLQVIDHYACSSTPVSHNLQSLTLEGCYIPNSPLHAGPPFRGTPRNTYCSTVLIGPAVPSELNYARSAWERATQICAPR